MLRGAGVGIVLILCACAASGGVVVDGSFGTRCALPGPNFIIPASMGKQVGNNLFESFSQFNLISSESATFTGPSNVQNILSRVTSGSPSSIDGKISSQIQGANLFFINPAGVMFGPHAQLDVSGSFAVTTADYVKLVGRGRFNANLGGGDVLTSAPVSAFGFLNPTPAAVSFTGSSLNVATQRSFSVIAGDITMSGGAINGVGARVSLVSVRSSGEVQLNPTDVNSAIDMMHFTALGTISLSDQALIDTSGGKELPDFTLTGTDGPGGGPVVIRARNFSLDNSQIGSQTTSSAQGGPIDIVVSQSMKISNGGAIFTETFGAGNAGEIDVHASDVKLIDFGSILGLTVGTGRGGNIVMTARSILLDGTDSQINSGTNSISSSSPTSGAGGDVVLRTGNLKITRGAFITTETDGGGDGGNIMVTAKSITIDSSGIEQGASFPSALVADSEFGFGKAGNIIVKTSDLKLTAGGSISSSTLSFGNGGNILVTAHSLLIDGTASPTDPNSGLPFRTGLFATSGAIFGGSANAGSVTVRANDVTIVGGGEISSSTETIGNAGSVNVTADSLAIDGLNSEISSGTSGDGAAGEVVVHAGELRLKNQGTITATTSGNGNAGSIAVHAGDVKMNGGSIASSSTSAGDAGSIKLVSDGTIRLTDQSSISVSALFNGGDIIIKAPVLVSLINSGINATAGNTGGNITIDPIVLQLKTSTMSASAGVQGGHIDLFTSFLLGPLSSITATGGMTNGTVNIASPELDLGAQLITLPASLISAENQLRERCTALLQGDFSSFISIGRGGIEPEPDELESEF